jgi:hypothetical protein
MRNKKKKQIFLSHAWGQDEEGRDNHQRTLQLAEKLKKNGYTVWIDQEQMYGNIDKAIMEGIKNCDIVIFCLTDKYINKINNAVYNNIPSDNCYKEWSYSLFLKKQIIPIVMEPYVKSNFLKEHGVVQMYLSNILYIDFSKSFDGKNFTELTRNLIQYNIFPYSRDSWTFRKAPTLSSSIKRTLSFSSGSPARVAPILRSPSKIQQIRHLVNL